MGCWNGTCGLSGLPIIHGQEMYVFPIIESHKGSFCYTSALYRPSVLPFRAEYNDYGAGENCSGPGFDLLIGSIRQQLVELDQRENQYHDIAIKRDKFDVDLFFEACHEQRLMFSNPMRGYEGHPPTLPVFFTMIRKDIADRLWNEWQFDLWKPRGMTETPQGFQADQYYLKNVTYAQLAGSVEGYMIEAKNRYDKDIKSLNRLDADKDLIRAKMFVATHYFFQEKYDERSHPLSSIMDHMFSPGYSDGGFARFADINELIVQKYLEGNEKEACDLIRECLVGYMINSFMSSTRRVWLPPMHQGSQSEELAEYRLMNRLVDDAVAERNREFEEYSY